jgi:hypothetical protein
VEPVKAEIQSSPQYKRNQTKNRTQPSYSSNYTLLKKVDSLAIGPGWKWEQIKVREDVADEDGMRGEEDLELWYRDPVAIVQDLVGNPAFKDSLAFAPQKVYTDAEGGMRTYDEMWTGDWWWKTQVFAWVS